MTRCRSLGAALWLSLAASTHAMAQESPAVLEGDWKVYALGDLGEMQISGGTYRFHPAAPWVLSSDMGGGGYSFTRILEGRLSCEVSDAGLQCRFADQDTVTFDLTSPCEWHGQAASDIAWFALSRC